MNPLRALVEKWRKEAAASLEFTGVIAGSGALGHRLNKAANELEALAAGRTLREKIDLLQWAANDNDARFTDAEVREMVRTWKLEASPVLAVERGTAAEKDEVVITSEDWDDFELALYGKTGNTMEATRANRIAAALKLIIARHLRQPLPPAEIVAGPEPFDEAQHSATNGLGHDAYRTD